MPPPAGRQADPFSMVGKPLPTSSDAGGTIDEIQDLLGHASMSSSQVYVHPDPARLRAAVDRVPSPREMAGPTR
jgi:site-specific recombinase XerC